MDIAAAYDEHARFIASSIQGLTGRGPHVDELLQETFIIALKKRGSFDGRSSLRTWLYGIAANLSRRHNRGAKRFRLFRERLQREVASEADTPESTALGMQRARLVDATLRELAFPLREVFVLYEVEGMEGEAIAALLGLPIGTVWTRLRNARARFTKLMRRHRLEDAS